MQNIAGEPGLIFEIAGYLDEKFHDNILLLHSRELLLCCKDTYNAKDIIVAKKELITLYNKSTKETYWAVYNKDDTWRFELMKFIENKIIHATENEFDGIRTNLSGMEVPELYPSLKSLNGYIHMQFGNKLTNIKSDKIIGKSLISC